MILLELSKLLTIATFLLVLPIMDIHLALFISFFIDLNILLKILKKLSIPSWVPFLLSYKK